MEPRGSLGLEGFWTLPLVMLLMVFPILLFVASRVLFPYEEIDDKAVDLEAYYWKKWPALFLIFFIMAITSILQNYLFLDLPPTEQFLQIALALLYLIFLVFKIKNRYAHIAFLSW